MNWMAGVVWQTDFAGETPNDEVSIAGEIGMVEDMLKSTYRGETQGSPTPSRADFCLFAILSLAIGLVLLLL